MAHKIFGSDAFQNGVDVPYYDIEEHCPHCDEVLPILIDFDQIHHFYVTALHAADEFCSVLSARKTAISGTGYAR